MPSTSCLQAPLKLVPPMVPEHPDDLLAENLRLRAAIAALTSRLTAAEAARDTVQQDLRQAQVEAGVAEHLIEAARQTWQQEFERDLARRRENARLAAEVRQDRERLAVQATEAEAEVQRHLEHEVGHRVMNEFALLQAQLHADERSALSTDAQHAFQTARKRVKAVAVLHDVLGQVEGREVENVADWLAGVVAKLEAALFRYTSQIRIEVSPPQAALSGRLADTLARCLGELLFNAAKYGAGEVLVRLELTPDRQWIFTARNHIGPPRAECFGTGSGLRLLGRMLAKLGGTVCTEQDNGLFTARVQLPAA